MQAVETIFGALADRPAAYMVATAGNSGSGKTTLCHALRERLPEAVFVPWMDIISREACSMRKGCAAAGLNTGSIARHVWAI